MDTLTENPTETIARFAKEIEDAHAAISLFLIANNCPDHFSKSQTLARRIATLVGVVTDEVRTTVAAGVPTIAQECVTCGGEVAKAKEDYDG